VIETTDAPTMTLAETTAQAVRVDRDARLRLNAALAALATADADMEAAKITAGSSPDDLAARKTLTAARRERDRLYDEADLLEAGAAEAERLRLEAEAAERAAEAQARRQAAYLEGLAHSRAGTALCHELADYLRGVQRDLGAHNRQFVVLAANEMGVRSRGGNPEHFDEPSSWGPIYNGLVADCERLARIYDRERRDET
jgi:hypothetical protein